MTLNISTGKQNYYAHIDPSSGKIKALDGIPTSDGLVDILLDPDLAKAFTTGVNRLVHWIAVKKDDSWTLVDKRLFAKAKFERIDNLKIQPLDEFDHAQEYDILVEIGKWSGVVLIHYNQAIVDTWTEPVKLYFTAEGNPTALKCALTLSAPILQQIAASSGKKHSPNPLVLKLPNAEDTSVFTPKTNLKMIIIRHDSSNH